MNTCISFYPTGETWISSPWSSSPGKLVMIQMNPHCYLSTTPVEEIEKANEREAIFSSAAGAASKQWRPGRGKTGRTEINFQKHQGSQHQRRRQGKRRRRISKWTRVRKVQLRHKRHLAQSDWYYTNENDTMPRFLKHCSASSELSICHILPCIPFQITRKITDIQCDIWFDFHAVWLLKVVRSLAQLLKVTKSNCDCCRSSG